MPLELRSPCSRYIYAVIQQGVFEHVTVLDLVTFVADLDVAGIIAGVTWHKRFC